MIEKRTSWVVPVIYNFTKWFLPPPTMNPFTKLCYGLVDTTHGFFCVNVLFPSLCFPLNSVETKMKDIKRFLLCSLSFAD